MFRHYLKTAVRNLWKSKAFSLINILGLTVGLSCCLLMALYIRHELSYDQFQEKGDRLVRVIMEYSFGGSVNKGNYTSTKVAPSFKKNFPEVEEGVRMTGATRIVKSGDKLFNEHKFVYADSTFFHMFPSFRVLEGDPKEALSGINKVLMVRSAANKYFGSEDPLGKLLLIGSNAIPYQVTGVMEDCPDNSQIKFDFLASFSSLGATQEETYYDANYTTYLLMKNPAGIASMQAKIPGFMKKEMAKEMSGGDYITYELEPFRRVHLYSPYEGFEPNNSISYIYITGGVVLLILLIACFTYINLSTARSIERAKEVGIRKVSGAHKNQIFRQFIGESLVISVLALMLSVILVILVLPVFNQLAEKQIHASDLLSGFTILFAVGVIAFISFLAGSYPAFVLSAYKPVSVLKGSFKNSGQGIWLRKSLLVFQFFVSVVLIVSTMIMQNQMHYIQHKKLGFDRDHVLVLPMDQKMLNHIEVIKNSFKSNPGILSVSRAVNDPTNIYGGYSMRSAEMPEQTQLMVTANPVDEDFVKTTGIQIIAGTDLNAQDIRDVSEEIDQKDKKYHYILNELAAKSLGWTPEQAIGKKMFLGNHRPGYVKAVVRDFHFASMHTLIKPLVLFSEFRSNILLVKLAGGNIPSLISFLQSKWKILVPHRPFEYHFLDEDYNKLYGSELRIGKVLTIFTGIAILLAVLGLFGLSAFSAQQRTKEIGVRKVLGASLPDIVSLLSKDFVQLAGIACCLGFPIAGWMMHRWLQDFAYRISMSVWIFVIAGTLTLMIALVTVSFQAIRAGLANPVKSLRTE